MKRILLLFALSSLLMSCVEDTQRNEAQEDFSVLIHTSYEPNGLHPVNDFSTLRSHIYMYTHRPLLKINLKTFDLQPLLVKELPSSDDGQKYLYSLREDVTWDDGTRVTRDDVEFTLKMNLCPLSNNQAIRPLYSSVIKGFEPHPTDPNKFHLLCNEQHAGNNQILIEANLIQKSRWDSTGIFDDIPFDAILNDTFERTDEVNAYFERFNAPANQYDPLKINGLGPYQITEWEKGQYITLERKHHWWGDDQSGIYYDNYPSKIVFRIIKDDNATMLAFRNRQIDVSNRLGTDELLRLRETEDFNANYESAFINQFSYGYMGLNSRPDTEKRTPFFTDQRVRRAMAHATPVRSIIDDLLHGKGGTEQVSMVSELKKDEYNDTLDFIEYDLNKASVLLTEAGWIDTDGDGLRDKTIDGKVTPFSLELNLMSGNQTTEDACLLIQESLASIGVECKLNSMDFSAFYQKAYGQDFDALMGAWSESAAYTDPLQLWHTDSWKNKGANFCGFGNAYSDSLIVTYNSTLDKAKRDDLMKALQAEVYEYQPYVFLYSTRRKVAIHKKFQNRNLYSERPGVMVNEFRLDPGFTAASTPETTE
ncbi:MAG: hypothetical protein J4F31_05005 [Flavobacteriales bacterium]|nr:hypothetical protein [Flavobacteriales bacterium]